MERQLQALKSKPAAASPSTPAPQPQVLDARVLAQVSGGLPRGGGGWQAPLINQLPRGGGGW